MHILIWALAALALGCWTLLAWASAWVLGLDPAVLGTWSGRVAELPGAAWLDVWLPGWDGLLSAQLELTRGLFLALGQVGPWLVWGLWALGAVLIVGCGAAASALVAVARRATASVTKPVSGSPAGA